jgi:hypothetical protein
LEAIMRPGPVPRPWRRPTLICLGLVLALVGALTLSARATSTGRPAAAPALLAAGGVPIGTGDDAQRVVDAHGAGTTYLVKAGTHLRNFSVRPKTGDTFCGEPGAVLDGGRSLRSAFSGAPPT